MGLCPVVDFGRGTRQAYMAVALYCGFATAAAAHDVRWSLDYTSRPVSLYFTYTDDSPMAFAKVLVTAPDGSVHQMGNTDRQGRFSVVLPQSATQETPKPWTMDVTGEEDHTVRATFEPTLPDRAIAVRQDVSTWITWLFLVSVLANVALIGKIFDMMKRRRNAP